MMRKSGDRTSIPNPEAAKSNRRLTRSSHSLVLVVLKWSRGMPSSSVTEDLASFVSNRSTATVTTTPSVSQSSIAPWREFRRDRGTTKTTSSTASLWKILGISSRVPMTVEPPDLVDAAAGLVVDGPEDLEAPLRMLVGLLDEFDGPLPGPHDQQAPRVEALAADIMRAHEDDRLLEPDEQEAQGR